MDQQAREFYELRFRAQFLESKGSAFQDLFVAIMSKAHPGDFIPCRPWGRIGDRKNDGYLKSERTLFQVYAPHELKAREAVRKIESDFEGALPHWRDYFDTWIFVHNSQEGLPPDVVSKLLELERLHVTVKVTHWGFNELLLRFRLLSLEALRSLYGSPSPPEVKKVSEAHRRARRGHELVREGKWSEGIKEVKEALALAREEGDEAEEVEILAGLALLSSERSGRGDRKYYFREAEKRVASIKSTVSKVIYLRARAAALTEDGDLSGAEEAYRTALHACCMEPEDEKGNLAAQGCIVRSSLVHLLCNQRRLSEANEILAECETYARQKKADEEGELFQAALEAGIHFSIEGDDEKAAVARIAELEEFADNSRLANRIGGDLVNIANHAAHRNSYHAALAAAEASIRLARQYDDGTSQSLLLGALYTEAMVLAKAGEDAKALRKAEAILDLCKRPDDEIIRRAAQHLIAEIRRRSGDSQAAVDLAKLALSAAKGSLEDIAFSKLALARALNDNGETEEALKQAREGWVLARSERIHPEAVADFLSHITNYASQLGAKEDLAEALTELGSLSDENEEVKTVKTHAIARASANLRLRERLLEVFEEADPAKAAQTEDCKSLAEANATATRPLIRLWKEVPDCLAISYDFWGRGNFERMLLNARRFENSFNVTVEVRSLDDVKRAIRLWSLYADFLILLWKGVTKVGLAITPFPENYGDPGGWGYLIAAGTVLKKRRSKKRFYPAMAHISGIPDEVAAFLASEALPFIKSGRLILVPAVGVGCINPGHGPFEQLLAEAANAIPNIRWRGLEGSPIGFIPHSPDAPFPLLAELAEDEADRLRKLRLLLLKRSRELRPDSELGLEAKALSLEIDDALRDLEVRTNSVALKKGLVRAKEPVAGATARFRAGGQKLTIGRSDSPFAPLLILQSLGYGWRVDGPEVPRFPPRFEPQEGDHIGTWLAPPSAGWAIPTVQTRVPSD